MEAKKDNNSVQDLLSQEEFSMETWRITPSRMSVETFNPIRAVVDTLKIPKGDDLIPLSIGDPTVFGNLDTPDSVIKAVQKQLLSKSRLANGYGKSVGLECARQAIAEYVETKTSPLTADDVIITSGGSHAIQMCIFGLVNPGENILIPRPGFPLYEVIAKSIGIEVRHYPLLADKQWEVDLPALAKLVDSRTRALFVINPSNPCGANYSKQHLTEILALADHFQLPVIADEIYAHMVFGKRPFVPLASLTTTVPVLSVGGLAKRFSVPGWRVGWFTIHDRNDSLKKVRPYLTKLSQQILSANSLIQAAIPDILRNTTQEYYDKQVATLEENGTYIAERVAKMPGLTPIFPEGAMYLMVRIGKEFLQGGRTGKWFAQALLDEEKVFVLPGACFGVPDFFRVVVCPPKDKLKVAMDRLEAFCKKYYQKSE